MRATLAVLGFVAVWFGANWLVDLLDFAPYWLQTLVGVIGLLLIPFVGYRLLRLIVREARRGR